VANDKGEENDNEIRYLSAHGEKLAERHCVLCVHAAYRGQCKRQHDQEEIE
jgi:hypothetical protein